jgi:hypothetical protein
MSDESRQFYSADSDSHIKPGTHAVEGVATEGTIGTVVGATLGAIAAIGTSVLVPGLGVVIAGPIVAGLVGGGARAVAGGLVGGLTGFGLPESNAAYEKVLKVGGVVIGVTPANSARVIPASTQNAISFSPKLIDIGLARLNENPPPPTTPPVVSAYFPLFGLPLLLGSLLFRRFLPGRPLNSSLVG